VEDKQPAAGDLTGDAGEGEEPAADAAGEPSADAAVENEDTATDSDSGEFADVAGGAVGEEADEVTRDDGEEADGTTPVGGPVRKPVGKSLAIALVVAAALFVGSAAFAGAMVQPYLADRAEVAIKMQVARTAANTITTLFTYTPDNMDGLANRASKFLTGDFEAQYRKFVDSITATNKQAQITTNTVVTGAAVESLAGPDATAIVYTNSTSTSPLTKNIPSLKYLSYRLTMKRQHTGWMVTRMTAITSLDLTPRL
jgi:Mce-associated membrane protein